MNQELVNQIVQAVLYEGYLLYPYRPSVKNRQRWTFGGVYPEAYSTASGGSDPCMMQTECLVRGGGEVCVEVTIRFLRLIQRSGEPGSLGDWQEASEQQIRLEPARLEDLVTRPQQQEAIFPAHEVKAPGQSDLPDTHREMHAIEASIELSAVRVGAYLYRLRLLIRNRTPLNNPAGMTREEAALASLASTHSVIHVRHGELISLTSPPSECASAAQACGNIGNWPVLVGDVDETDTMLASPIILYDYPQIAPESPGDLFDGTEIDEILTLRIMTLTDDEKREASALDPRGQLCLPEPSRSLETSCRAFMGRCATFQSRALLSPVGCEGVKHATSCVHASALKEAEFVAGIQCADVASLSSHATGVNRRRL